MFGSHIRKLIPAPLRSPASWEDFFKQFNSYLNDPKCQELTIDFGKTGFIHPETVIVILSAARLWHRERGTRIEVNFMDDVQSYLSRMNVFEECSAWLVPTRRVDETLDRSQNSKRLMEVTPIPSDEVSNANGIVLATMRAKSILEEAQTFHRNKLLR